MKYLLIGIILVLSSNLAYADNTKWVTVCRQFHVFGIYTMIQCDAKFIKDLEKAK